MVRVPHHWISTKPVRKVPRILPAVERAYILPTTLPVCSRSFSSSLITTGVTIPRMMLGAMKSDVTIRTMRGSMGTLSNRSETNANMGRMARLDTPPASRIRPSVVGSGLQSAMRPPR